MIRVSYAPDIENLDYGTGDQRLRSVKTRSAALGEGVTMDCRISLPGPISYTWSKQGGSLPFKSVSQNVSQSGEFVLIMHTVGTGDFVIH